MNIGIVGGGIGAMTTALLLTKKGFDITIYEKEDRLGGRLAFEEGAKHKIDRGPTIVLLPDMLLEVLEEAGIDRSKVELIPCSPMYDIHFNDGTTFKKWQDTYKQYEEIRKVFPGEEENFPKYMKEMQVAYDLGKPAFLEKSFIRKRDFFTMKNLFTLSRLSAFKSVKRLTRKYFKDERLQHAFSLQTLYIGGAPHQSPGIYSLIPFAEHAFGIWYLKGGYASLVPILEKELMKRGVTIHKNTSVEKLIINDGICKGVRTNKKTLMHDAIIFNGEIPHLESMIETEPYKNKSRAYTPSSGCVTVYLGTNKRWSGTSAHQFFLSEDFHSNMTDIFERNEIPEDPSFYVFSPTQLDEEAAPPGDSVLYFLIPVPSAGTFNWEHETQRLVDQAIEKAESLKFTGLRDSITWKKVRTPLESKQDGLYEGGSFGLAPILKQSGVYRPQMIPYPVENLYAVGASVHPGGGIPIVMQGARLLANYLLKELSDDGRV